MITLENVFKRFGQREILKNIDFSLASNDNIVLLGPSGAGKTTLLKIIAGLEQPDSGKVVIGSKTMADHSEVNLINRQVGMIFQDLALWPHMTVLQNIDFVAQGTIVSSKDRQAYILDLLKKVRLINLLSHFPYQLSGGERQRLAIARALAAKPLYLLMDEPFASLDPILTNEMIELINDLKTTMQLTVLFVTHDIDQALNWADCIYFMYKGQLVNKLNNKELSGLSREQFLQWYKKNIIIIDGLSD